MKIILTQQEIEAAITAHVLSTISVREGTDLKIDFTATRSTDGITATIDIPYMGVSSIDLPMTSPVTEAQQDTTSAGTKATLPTKPKAPAANKPKGGIFGGLPSPAPVADNAAVTATEASDNAEQAAVDSAEAEQASDAADAAATEAAAPAAAAGKSLFGTD